MTVGKAKRDGRVAGGSVQISLRVKTPGRLPRLNELPPDALPGSHSEGPKKNPLLLQKGGGGKTATIDYTQSILVFLTRPALQSKCFTEPHLPGFYQSLIHLGGREIPNSVPSNLPVSPKGKTR